MSEVKSEDVARALLERDGHNRSVLACIDEYLHRLTDTTNSSGTYCGTKEDFIAALLSERAEFQSRIDAFAGLSPP